jgi:hypothetical protein
MERRGEARTGRARYGAAGNGRRGSAWLGMARNGWVRRGMAGADGAVWRGRAGRGLAGVFEMTDPWIDHKDSCAQCGAKRVMIADGLCRACWRETNGDAEMEREDVYSD